MKKWIRKIGKPTRTQLLCILCGAVLGLLSWFNTGNGGFLKKGNVIERNGPGGIDSVYELTVGAEGYEAETLRLKVSRQHWEEKEAQRAFSELIEELPLFLLNGNTDLTHVRGDLSFPKRIASHDGILLSYYPQDLKLIDYDGTVQNVLLETPCDTTVRVHMRADHYTADYLLPITVCKRELSPQEDWLERLARGLLETDEEQYYRTDFRLPEEIDGVALHYQVKRDMTPLKLFLMGLFAAVLLHWKPAQDRRQEKKERENALLLDYSELVSKLIVYTEAGFTVRNAFENMAETYREKRKHPGAEARPLYEEILTSVRELQNGLPESKVYHDFGARCGLRCYGRLAALIEQNRRNGERGFITALELEMQDAFEQRKNTARRLGEEAGTKLMLPLILSLITVMAIIAVPAMMTLM